MSDEEIYKICKRYKIKNYTINDDGSIDVNGNVFLYKEGLRKLPLKFNKVSGYFECSGNNLVSLKGAPKKVGNEFVCSSNELTSLEGGPKEVGGDLYCHFNKLTSLKGAPKKVGGDFNCCDNNLPNLKYAPLDIGGGLIHWGNSVDLDYDKYLKRVKRMNKLSQL